LRGSLFFFIPAAVRGDLIWSFLMHQKTTPPKHVPSPRNKIKTTSEPMSSDKSADADAYSKVRRFLENNRVEDALTLARSRHDAPMKNAQGVCLMRLGKPDEAVRVYRTLVLDNTGLFLRDQLPTVYKTNYAFALMLSGHASGGLNILKELSTEDHPSVHQLRSAIEAWKAKLSLLQKLGLAIGLEPKRPMLLDFPPGELL
jgi:hypothetical protein